MQCHLLQHSRYEAQAALLTADPLDGVTGCFANKDCREQILQ